MSSLMQMWPGGQRVRDCIRTEAETGDEALLLAVHERVQLLHRPPGEGVVPRPATEQQLLDELLRPADDGSAVVVAITGASGVGKSHMVRWLQAQLARHPDRERLIVVSIPKTASLGTVVGLVLSALPSDEFRELQRDIDSVVEDLDPELSADVLRVTLVHALGPWCEALTASIRAGAPVASEGPRVTLGKHLRTVLQDAAASELWLRPVMRRIVTASIRGTDESSERQFSAGDLVPPDAMRTADLPHSVQLALAYLSAAGGERLAQAAAVLQELLDQALRQVFRFTDTLGRRTFDDIVDEIRRRLLDQQSDLVLLVEDLAALAGIQEPLMRIMIGQSDQHGRKVRATIRSAIAVTDGFLAGRNTVLGRARGEWVVQSEGLDDAEVTRRLISMTGRYLNAARLGLDTLRDRFRDRRGDTADLSGWVPRFEDENPPDEATLATLEAFGRSAEGYSLFPFNDRAVRSLAAAVMCPGGRWNYNPRTFITRVLRAVLEQRPLWERGDFPAPAPGDDALTPEVVRELEHQDWPEADLARVRAALSHWAGAPATLVVPTVPKPVFDALGLRWPFHSETGRAEGTTSKVETGGQGNSPPPPPPPPPHPPAPPFEAAVDAWTTTIRLTGSFPKRARDLLAAGLNDRIDLDAIGLRRQRIDAAWFWLPPANTTSNPARGIVVRVAGGDGEIPALVKSGLKALSRWADAGRQWDFEGAENSYAEASALLDTLEPAVTSQLLARAMDDTAALARALHRQNLLLGIASSVSPRQIPLPQFLAAAPAAQAVDDASMSPVGRAALSEQGQALAGRPAMRALLRSLIGRFQGATGDKLLAIDAERLQQAWRRDPVARWVMTGAWRDAPDPATAEALVLLSPGVASERLVPPLRRLLETCREAFEPLVDRDFSRVEWQADLIGTMNLAREIAWPPLDPASVEAAIRALCAEGSDVTLRRLLALQVSDLDTDEAVLAAAGTVNVARLAILQGQLAMIDRFLRQLSDVLSQRPRPPDADEAQRIRTTLASDLQWRTPQ